MSFLSSSNNAILVDNCQSLQNLTVTLQVTEDLITLGNVGFSMQVNSYPQPGSLSQGQTLNWFQYIIYVFQNTIWYEIQYWAIGASKWPPGYTPNANTTPWLPALPNDYYLTSFGSVANSQIAAGSVMKIQLATDASGNVTAATFSVTDPSNNVSSSTFTFPSGAVYPIYGFQMDLVGPGGGVPCTFTSGAGTLTYSVSPGTLSVQGTNTCGGSQPGTAETSNAVYGAITPATGSTVTQSLNCPSMGMEFKFDKSTFGQDEVKQSSTWGLAYWLSISGFPNASLGFNSPSDLSATPSPLPTVTAAINASLNPGLTAAQLATIANNLPVVKTFGPPPVQAIDDTLIAELSDLPLPVHHLFP